jgi:hypothetical protein
MQYIKLRDILEFLMWGFGIVALIFLAGFLETAPLGITMWVAVLLAIVLWIAWIIIVAKQRKAESNKAVLWMVIDGYWVAQDGSGRRVPMRRTNNQPVFDQDEDAIKHLDFEANKEKRA